MYMCCNKNIVDFLLIQRDIAFYLVTTCCVKLYTEKNTQYVLYCKLTCNINIFVQSKSFAWNIVSEYVIDVILLVLLEFRIQYSSFDFKFGHG